MADKTLGEEFDASRGERILAIFMLSDAARRQFRAMQEQAAKELERLRAEQRHRREEDIAEAKQVILTGEARPALQPPWKKGAKGMRSAYVQKLAEHRVAEMNEREAQALRHLNEIQEDTFLAKEQERRILKEATERSGSGLERKPDLRDAFDKARGPSRDEDFEQSR